MRARRLLILIAAVVVASACLAGCGGKSSTAPPPPPQGGARNEVEPNDFTAQSLGALGANDFVVSGAISSGADVDLYSVSSSTVFSLYASVDWNTASDDLELAISNSNGVFVRHVNTAGHPEACTIAGLPAGTYAVRVDALGSASTSYQLTIGTR